MKNPTRKPMDLKEGNIVDVHIDSLSNRSRHREFQSAPLPTGPAEDERQTLIIHYCLERRQFYSYFHHACPNCGAKKERSLNG